MGTRLELMKERFGGVMQEEGKSGWASEEEWSQEPRIFSPQSRCERAASWFCWKVSRKTKRMQDIKMISPDLGRELGDEIWLLRWRIALLLCCNAKLGLLFLES
jgi:hypothetical protein